MAEPDTNRVAVTDFDMPFFSMVRFMVKWAVAAIPALFIIMVAAALFWGFVLGGVTTLGTALMRKDSTPVTPTTGIPDAAPTTTQGKIEDRAVKEYLTQVVVSKVHVAHTVLDQMGVFGEVKNTGDRTLKEVEITIYCLDTDGKPVFEKKFYPVLATEFSFGDQRDPLKPGYSRTFGVKMDDAPSEWAKKVNITVTSVAFQGGGT